MNQKGSQAELQGKKPIIVTLKAHDWIGKNTCDLKIMSGTQRIVTDVGYARLDMSQFAITFGATDGFVNNGDYLTKVMLDSADKYLKQYEFQVVVDDMHPEVRFKLVPIMAVKKLELSAHFVTSLATFSKLELPQDEAVAA